MRFESLDLNLLVALEALIDLRSVSATARKLHLSQSAISGALKRLRTYFDDELLTVNGREMVLTQRAIDLAEPVRNALAMIRATITAPAGFDPLLSRRSFSVVASDYIHVVLIRELVADLAVSAPGVSLNLLQPNRASLERFWRGEVDAFITVKNHLIEDHPQRLLFSDRAVGVCWRDNLDVGESISASHFAGLGHVASVLPGEQNLAYFDLLMADLGFTRRIEVRVPGFSLVPHMLIGTRRVAVMHSHLANEAAKTLPVRTFELPFDLPLADETVQWHVMREADEGVRWLLGKLTSLSRRLQC